MSRASEPQSWSRPREKVPTTGADRMISGVHGRQPLGQFLSANGGVNARQQMLTMNQEAERIMNSTSLDHLPAGAMIGQGLFKDCYEIKGTENALIVSQKYTRGIKEELATLFRLQSIGIPVAPILAIGKFRGQEAMIQPRFRHMLKFNDSASPGFDLVRTGIANRNTIDSLKNIRDVVQREGILIEDLQGGLDSNPNSRTFGAFLVNDPLGIEKADNHSIMGFSNAAQVQKLNTAIALLEQVIR
ncbi:hypothetical protein ACSFA3_03730 [Variovorax sp. RHLX14]|uniref:hypothetical protein n=1 Tax=Variovorax sp. RHLX14 TaxID=1259731 RepID=UPI003F48DEB8